MKDIPPHTHTLHVNQYVNQYIYEVYDTRAVLLNIDSFWLLCANISTTIDAPFAGYQFI